MAAPQPSAEWGQVRLVVSGEASTHALTFLNTDSAGRPLSQTPPGTLLLAIASAAVERFAPVPLLTLLNHPLVRQGDERLRWLDGVRLLDELVRANYES